MIGMIGLQGRMKREGQRETRGRERERKKNRLSMGIFAAVLFLAIFTAVSFRPAWAGISSNVVRDGGIAGVSGFRFENMVYRWDRLIVDVVNMTGRSQFFGGTMVFLNRFSVPVASACFLPQKVPGNSVKRYTCYFTEGSGETARRAMRVVWDFGAR
jgi:hypothetical protein